MATGLMAIDYGDVQHPGCDFHRMFGFKRDAKFYGVTTEGVPAYMCDDCFQDYGVGLNNELGYELGDVLFE